MRNLKSDAEIANMRKVGQASGRAYTDAMRQAWTTEKDLAAFMDYKFKLNGCDGRAYIPVVAGGQVRIVSRQSSIGRLTVVEW
jgi:intermediate cleaving peptidase 55